MNFKRRQFLAASLKAAMFLPFIGRSVYSLAATEADSAKREAAIRDLVLANHILYRHEVLDGYGHISVRDPLNPRQYLLSRYMPSALVSAADIMTWDLDSNPVGGDTRGGYSERFIHGEIYRVRPDVNAVVHCHTPALVAFADSGVPLKGMSQMGYFMTDGVPVYEVRDYRAANSKDMLVDNRDLGASLAKVLGPHNAALMRGHGAVVVGPDVPQVAGRAFYLKVTAQIEQKALALGSKVTYMDPGEANPENYGSQWRVWVQEETSGGCASAPSK